MSSKLQPTDSYIRFLAPPTQKPAPEHIRRLLSKYRITSFLGAGGFANVYEGTDADGLNVAIKIPQFQMKKTMDSTTLKNFVTEADIWTKLHHENIVGIYTTGIKPLPHIVMELMDGGSLDDLMKNHQLTVREAVHIMFQILRGVSYAHQMATVHRDLKPENILFTSDGVVKITDWGIGKYMASEGITKTIETKGTIAYSAPEQFDRREYGKVDWQTDIFQLGILFYEMLTGVKPFDGKGIADVMGKVLEHEPELPSKLNSNIPAELDEIVMGALEKYKEDRWNSSAVMLHELKKVIKDTVWKTGRERISHNVVKEVRKRNEILDEVYDYIALLREIDVDVAEYITEIERIENYAKLRWHDRVNESCALLKKELLIIYRKKIDEIDIIPRTELQVNECNRHIQELLDECHSKNIDIGDILDMYNEAMKEYDRGYLEVAGEKLFRVRKRLESSLVDTFEKYDARKEFNRLNKNPQGTSPPEGLRQLIEDDVSESWVVLNQWEKNIQEDGKINEVKEQAREEFERLSQNMYGIPPPDDLDRLIDEDVSRSWEKINEWKISINEEWTIRKELFNNSKRSSVFGRILSCIGSVLTVIAFFLSLPSKGYHYSNSNGVIEESYYTTYPGHPLNYFLAFGGLISSLGAIILLALASSGFGKINRSNKVETGCMVASIVALVVCILIFMF